MAPSTFRGVPSTAPRFPAAVLIAALLLLILAGRCPWVGGCVHCGLQFKNLKLRFARLCAQYREHYNRTNCTKYPWRGGHSPDLALDELSLDLLLEKTHRVFRVIEINQSLADFPKYWNWLHEVKMPEQGKEALCPPACQGAASAFNCSTCRRVEVPCWDLKTCYPGGSGLQRAVRLLSSVSGSCLLLGLVSCALEFRLRPGIGTA